MARRNEQDPALPGGAGLAVRISSLGFRTDVAIRVAEGGQVSDHSDYLVVRTPANPDYRWGNFLLLADVPGPDEAGKWLDTFAAAFRGAEHRSIGLDVGDGRDVDAGLFGGAGLSVERSVVL